MALSPGSENLVLLVFFIDKRNGSLASLSLSQKLPTFVPVCMSSKSLVSLRKSVYFVSLLVLISVAGHPFG